MEARELDAKFDNGEDRVLCSFSRLGFLDFCQQARTVEISTTEPKNVRDIAAIPPRTRKRLQNDPIFAKSSAKLAALSGFIVRLCPMPKTAKQLILMICAINLKRKCDRITLNIFRDRKLLKYALKPKKPYPTLRVGYGFFGFGFNNFQLYLRYL